jgi:hypothetical protein
MQAEVPSQLTTLKDPIRCRIAVIRGIEDRQDIARHQRPNPIQCTPAQSNPPCALFVMIV